MTMIRRVRTPALALILATGPAAWAGASRAVPVAVPSLTNPTTLSSTRAVSNPPATGAHPPKAHATTPARAQGGNHAGLTVALAEQRRPERATSEFLNAQKNALREQIAKARPAGKTEASMHALALERLDQPLYGLPVSQNKEGERVVYVYRGGLADEHTKIDMRRVYAEGILGKGVYFTADPAAARQFASEAATRWGGEPKTARVLRFEIPAADLAEGGQRVKLMGGTPWRTLSGKQFDGPMILHLGGFDPATGISSTGVFGAFTDGAYVNSLRREVVEVLPPPTPTH